MVTETTTEKASPMPKPTDYKSNVNTTWCPSCGDFSVLNSIYQAFARLGLQKHNTVIVSGIGCSSRLPYFVDTYGVHSIHGRVLPIATGIALGNLNLTVVGVGGDGDAFSIGMGHFPHTARRNIDICYIVMDNEIYGLTKGQVSPTSSDDLYTKTNPYGTIENPINPVSLAISVGATYVARGFSGTPKDIVDLIAGGIDHKGFALIQILSPCVTYNKVATFQSIRPNVKPLPGTHSTTNKFSAIELSYSEQPIYLGLFYKAETETIQDKINKINSKASANAKEHTLKDIFNKYR